MKGQLKNPRSIRSILQQEDTVVDTLKPLVEIMIKMKFWGNKGDTLARCEKAGIFVHVETQAEYDQKRKSQWDDGRTSGLDVERYGRVDAKGNIVFDPGVQILSGETVKLNTFRTDAEEQGFKLVGLEAILPFGGKPDAYLFTSTYSKANRPVRRLTDQQRKMQDWFFNRMYGHVYVWRNFGGAQLDIPAASSFFDPKVEAIMLRMYNEGRVMRMGSEQVIVEFENQPAVTTQPEV